MRILFVITRADTIGGGQQHVIDLANGLWQQGHTVWVAHGPGEAMAERFLIPQENQFELSSMRPEVGRIGDDLSAYRSLRRIVDAVEPDAMALHSTKAGILGRLVAAKSKLPAIYTLHGITFSEGIRPHRRLLGLVTEVLLRPLTTHSIAVSEYDRMLSLKFRTSRQDKIQVIYNAVPEVSHRAVASDLEPVKLISVARVDAQKDHETLLRALAGLPKGSWNLELVGDGPKLQEIRELAEQLGISQSVSMPGRVNDVAERLAMSQIFVLATHYEGLPISIIEAMRGGLPVIASNVGGVSELVSDGVNGFTVSHQSVDEMRLALESLIEDVPMRERFGRESRARYEQEFDYETFVENTLNLYEKVLEGLGTK